MSKKSFSLNLSLGFVGSLLAVGLSQNLSLNSQKVVAQEESSCPLPTEITVTFLDSKCKAVKLEQPQTYYRYYSGDNNKFGRYLTTNQYKTNAEAIRNLALKQEWGNKATMMLSVTVPAGITVYQGIVAPQPPASCYPGGGNQTFIQDSKDPNIKWTELGNMIVKHFSCP